MEEYTVALTPQAEQQLRAIVTISHMSFWNPKPQMHS